MPETMISKNIPLCVDLDGTLLKTDTLQEQAVVCLRRGLKCWWGALKAFVLQGRPALKAYLAGLGAEEVMQIPLRPEVLEFLAARHEAGQKIILATAAAEEAARAVPQRVPCISQVMATDGKTNLKGKHKAAALVAAFGEHGFDYIGDARADIPVWQAARCRIAIAPRGKMPPPAVAQVENLEPLVVHAPSWWKSFWQGIRPHQWAKNLLLLVPLVTSHQLLASGPLISVLIAFLALSLAASALYLLNDTLDLHDDRLHAEKKIRPLASGNWSLSSAIGASLFLACFSAGIALNLPPLFGALLLTYAGTSLLYILFLKRWPGVDILCLSALYVLRILLGGAAAGIPISGWLLGFAALFFPSLALLKRFGEMQYWKSEGRGVVPGRAYSLRFLRVVPGAGILCALLAVGLIPFYVHSSQAQQLYGDPGWLWLLLPLVFGWNLRLWVLAGSGKIPGDPVSFALRDWPSYAAGIAAGIVLLLAMWSGR